MAALFTNRTTNGDSSGVAYSGSVTVHVSGTLGGAILSIQTSSADTPANYRTVGIDGVLTSEVPRVITGKGYVRVSLANASSTTNVSVDADA